MLKNDILKSETSIKSEGKNNTNGWDVLIEIIKKLSKNKITTGMTASVLIDIISVVLVVMTNTHDKSIIILMIIMFFSQTVVYIIMDFKKATQ